MHEKRDEIDVNDLSSNIIARTGSTPRMKTNHQNSLARTGQREWEGKNMAPDIQGRAPLNENKGKFSFLGGLLDNDNHIMEKTMERLS